MRFNMKTKELTLLIASFFVFGLQINSCNQKGDDKLVELGGPAKRTNVVVFFKKETTNEEMNAFWQNVLKTEAYKLALQFRIINNSYEGVGVNFSTDATPEQRERLKKAIKESPIVYKVYENVVPNEIKDL